MRPATPLAAARAENETAFADYYSRPATPAPLRARPTTPFADYYNDDGDVEPESESELMGPGAGVSRRERGQGWSGEWNQRDMQAVIAKLRSLK
ncbi:hypothetical protein B0H15DRAFT_824958 [Mycena belliarum]|uniref:Uncharacterized protein n=1 Tax=Mycena belliarum TaxID=1033014 RepID=A0AAD6UAJ6_9AGAR|nr:hypothetical protein B0H15DRAFT_824937 [Mycena belliae]KAJ7097140.1 hypothetical protein B0H15DRAFT_824958 [Mycena belliae]